MPHPKSGKQPPVLDHDTELPYGDRSVRMILFILALVVAVIVGTTLIFFGEVTGEDTTAGQKTAQSAAPQAATPASTAPARSDEPSAVQRFFEDMFSGADDGLDPDDMNLDEASPVEHAVRAQLSLQEQAQSMSRGAGGYRHSLYDVIDAQVIDESGQDVGEITDILVNQDTGAARTLILDEDNHTIARDLKDIQFSRVFKQAPDGTTRLSISDSAVEEKPGYSYAADEPGKYISLRRLRGGQLLDFEGNVAGQIDAVIYGNAEAQGLVIDLRPTLDRADSRTGNFHFFLPFSEADFVENPDGLDIKLTKEQTRALAQQLFIDSRTDTGTTPRAE